MLRLQLSCLLATAIVVVAEAGVLAQTSSADPYKQTLIVVNGPGTYWGYVRPKSAAAEIIDSAGQYLINKQQARLQNEQVRQKQIETRKKEIEFWVWKDKFVAEAIEEKRKREKAAQLRRAADDPPSTEIYAGISLNTLLKDLIKRSPLTGPSTPVDPETLAHIHLRSEADHGLGLLSQDKIFWPPLLTTEFPDKCEQVQQTLNQVKQQAASSRGVNPKDLLAVRRELDTMKTRIDERVKARQKQHDVVWSPDNFIGAKRLLRQIDDSAATLQRNPEATFYLRPLAAQSVSELVKYMTDKGLVFGEAMAGDERHYVSLKRALAEELRRVRPSSSGSQR
jgi:hypothetical protein